MFSIKICGITRGEDALAAVAAGADAIGLNFYRGSKRFVKPEQAREVSNAVGDTVLKVGVFVNSSESEVSQIATDVGLDWVQLHGDERPDFLMRIPPQFKILRVYRVKSSGLVAVKTDLTDCQVAGRVPDGILVDSFVPGEYGGTGMRAGEILFNSLRLDDSSPEPIASIPWLLAGGLTPENVAEAIRQSRPDGVDVASGVESSPGIKNSAKLEKFIFEARQAIESIRSN